MLPTFGNDPNAWVKDVKPFLIKGASQFRSDGPYDLTSPKYAREFNEVKTVGSASAPLTDRSLVQTNAALYWAENPPRTWNRIFNSLSASEGVSLVDNARLFAELYLTIADTFIAVWDEKGHYLFWRPITAIREADSDGNSRTEKDGNWLPLVANPGYPEHPSGHLGLSGASGKTLQQFFPYRSSLGPTPPRRRADASYTRVSRRRRRDRRCASGPGSTSGTPTKRASRSRGRSPASRKHY